MLGVNVNVGVKVAVGVKYLSAWVCSSSWVGGGRSHRRHGAMSPREGWRWCDARGECKRRCESRSGVNVFVGVDVFVFVAGGMESTSQWGE
ncbi:MAG: hypothetical protein U0X93_01875 [Anaerolineales bacterium]